MHTNPHEHFAAENAKGKRTGEPDRSQEPGVKNQLQLAAGAKHSVPINCTLHTSGGRRSLAAERHNGSDGAEPSMPCAINYDTMFSERSLVVSSRCLRASVVTQMLFLVIAFFLLSSSLSTALRAADAPNAEEDRLRAALREMTQQLRSAQTELSNLQATQASLADEKKTLSEKYETLKKQVMSDRAAADKAAADSAARAVDQKAAIARLEAALEKAKAEGEKSAQEARAAEAQDVKLTAESYALQRRAADRETKNLALFLLANEILSRYEDFSLGKALNAKEPFVGATRTKLENLVQDYQDKILDQRAK